MKTLHLTLAAALQITAVLAQAQTGIGTPGLGDANVALHVKRSALNTAGPIRLEGIGIGSTETDVVVTDANGVLRYRSAASLLAANPDLWVNNASVISPVSNRQVAIGQTGAATASDRLTVNGNATWVAASQLRFRDGANYIYSDTDNNNWYFKGQTYVSFRDRANAVDLFTVQASSGRVGVKERNPNVDFEVNGTQRMAGSNVLEFGSNLNRVYRFSDDDLRVVGQTQVNFMDRTNATKIMTVDAVNSRVGIGTATPVRNLHVQGAMRLTGDVGTPDLTSDLVLVADANGDIRRATVASIRGTGGADNLGNHTATQNIRLGAFYLSGDGTNKGVSVNMLGQVGIGTLAPTRTLHVRENTSLVAEVLIENATVNRDAVLRFAEGNVDMNLGYALTYEGLLNQMHFGNNQGDVHMNIARNSGNVAIGNGATATTVDKLLVNGQTRVTGTNKLVFGNDAKMFVSRFANPILDDLDIVSEAGGVHVHAPNFQVTGSLPGLKPMAFFNSDQQRVGLGTQTAPLSTVHISPATGDFPLRIDNMPVTPNNGNQYYRLLIDDQGIVYRTKRTYNGDNGFTGQGAATEALQYTSPSPSSDLTAVLRENEELKREQAAMKAEFAELASVVSKLQARVSASEKAAAARQ